MTWKNAFELGKNIVLATSSKDGIPHAIVVTSKGFVEDKLLINACQMDTTLRNIRETNKVCIVASLDDQYFRIKGTSKIYSSGKYFDIAKTRNKPPPVKHAILVEIEEVFDLDKVKRIY